jgi:hypothetical protein
VVEAAVVAPQAELRVEHPVVRPGGGGRGGGGRGGPGGAPGGAPPQTIAKTREQRGRQTSAVPFFVVPYSDSHEFSEGNCYEILGAAFTCGRRINNCFG